MVFGGLGLVCAFITLVRGFMVFLILGFGMSPIYKGKNIKFRDKVSELNLGFKHDMVFSFGFVLMKFSFFFLLLLYLRFGVFKFIFSHFYFAFLIKV